MRIKVLLILLFLSINCFAQAPSDTITVNVGLPKSYGASYSSFAIGATAEFWKEVSESRRIFVGGRFGIDRQRKDYLDSGITLRGSVTARVGLPVGQSWAIRPFAGVGVSFSQQRNPQYTKASFAPKIEAGISTRDNRFFAYGIAFLPDSTENKVRGWGLGFDYYWRLSPRLSLHAGGVMTRFKFYQPYGNFKGWYTGGGFTPAFGVTWHLKPEQGKISRSSSKLAPAPRATPVPPIGRSQTYVGEFERQFMKEKQ